MTTWHEGGLRAAEHLRSFIEDAPVAIAMFDRSMRYVAASRRWQTDHGLPDQELSGRLHYDVFPEMPERWKDVHRRCLAGTSEQHDGELFVRADGSRQWIRWAVCPWRTAAGVIGGILIFSEDITAQKEAEAALRRNEAKVRAVLQALAEGVVFLDRQGHVVEANDAASTLGHTLEQLTDPILDPRQGIVRPDGTPFPVEEQPAMVALRTGDSVRDVEMRVPTVDGQLAWRLVNAQPVYDDEHQMLGAVASFFDITARKEAEEAVLDSERQLRLALDASGAGIWRWEVKTNELHWDARCFAMFGLSPTESPTFENWAARLHDEDRPRLLARVERILQTPGDDHWSEEFRAVRPDGSTIWLYGQGRVERDAGGTATRFTGINLDVTARRHTEVELEASRQRLRVTAETARLLFETTGQGIVSVDEHGTIVAANVALATMFGWDPASLVGQSIEQLVPQAVRARHEKHRADYLAAPHGRPMGLGMDLTGQRKDGTTFPVEVSLNHVTTSSRRRVIAFVSDISARKQAENELRRQRDALQEHARELELRSDQLSRLASDLTLAEQRAREQLAKTLHDHLQQLLFSATLKVDRLSKQVHERPVDAALLQRVSGDLSEAIAASRSLAVELFPPVLHEGGLAAALTWLAEWMAQKYGLKVTLTADAAANPARKDIRTLVFESVRELLFNVVKHAGVDCVAVDLALTSDDLIQITVTDDGAGFDPANRLSQSGAARQGGLGLFSIRERLALLGGRLEIESARGRGTRFTLCAPRHGVERRAAALSGPAEREA